MYKYIVFKARSNLYKLLCPPARSKARDLSPIGALVYYFQQISSFVSSNNPNNYHQHSKYYLKETVVNFFKILPFPLL